MSPTPLPSVGSTTTDASSDTLYPAFSNSDSEALRDLNRYVQLETSAVVQALRREGYLGVSLVPTNVGVAPLNCSSGTSPDMNGLLLGDAAPAIEPGSFHPTAAGQDAMASSVLASWRRTER